MRCEEAVKVIEILRLWEQGYSQRAIAQSVQCAKSTVGRLQQRSQEQGLSYQEAAKMTDREIQERLYPLISEKKLIEDPDWKSIHEHLQNNRRLNLQFLWEEYHEQKNDGLGYSQFCRRYNKWRTKTGKEVVMVQEREPGKELFVDWMGDTLACVKDSTTGKFSKAHFFVSTLGDSSYPYVEAFPNEGMESWLDAHIHALEWYGGAPQIIVPDNCKTAVTRPSNYDPVINPAYCELAAHYKVAVIPAKVRSPRWKASVESSVGWLETWLVEWLKRLTFFSFEELNQAISIRVKDLAKRPFQKRKGSRESVFNEIDKPALRPLPGMRYERAAFLVRRVPDNYHVQGNDDFYYSVPYTLYKQKVTLRITSTMVEVLNSERQRVALHPRRKQGSLYVTVKEHMPLSHQWQAEARGRTGSWYRSWAKRIGEYTLRVIDGILTKGESEQAGYRSCMGILGMVRKHGPLVVEAACKKAFEAGKPNYYTVKTCIENEQEQRETRPTPVHENLRDPEEFIF